jgi:hypothetical protein
MRLLAPVCCREEGTVTIHDIFMRKSVAKVFLRRLNKWINVKRLKGDISCVCESNYSY